MEYRDIVAQSLIDNGLDVMFGVLGDANMYIGERYAQLPGARFIPTAHEAGALLMAAGFAGASQRVGAATVTHGAITNTVGALFEAVRGRYPLVLIAGDTAEGDRFNLQNLPHEEIVRPTGAGFIQAGSVDTAQADVAAAVRMASEQQRPVVLNIPSNFQRQSVDVQPYTPMTVFAEPHRVPDREALEEAAALIVASNRPLILAGRGAARAGAEAALVELAERIGAPLATTLRGKGLFRGEPHHIGVYGTLSSDPGLDTIVNSDCLIVFGASLSPLTALKGELLTGKKIIHIDIDPRALGGHFSVDVGIAGDLIEAARGLIELMDEAEAPAAAFRSDRLAQDLVAWNEADRQVRQPTGSLDIRDAMFRINELVPLDRTMAIDAGRFAHEALRIMQTDNPLTYLHALNIAQIGMSLSYGIGGSVGAPERPSIVVIGDGGFMLGGLTEFNTAVRENINVAVFVINDEAYGAEYHRFVDQDMVAELTTFDWPDLANLAVALGGRGVTVNELSDFDQVAKELARTDGPLLVDVRLDRDEIPDPGAH